MAVSCLTAHTWRCLPARRVGPSSPFPLPPLCQLRAVIAALPPERPAALHAYAARGEAASAAGRVSAALERLSEIKKLLGNGGLEGAEGGRGDDGPDGPSGEAGRTPGPLRS